MTRRAILAGSAATAAPLMRDFPVFNSTPSPDLAEMHRLAAEAEAAYAVYDRIAENELDGETEAFGRFIDLEDAVRMVPATSIEGVVFKLRHIMADALWPDVESCLARPIILIAADLERIGGAP
ncbi:MAG: hypothetical protein ACR2RE_29265 [Geminicoccaceae bacterium]